MSNLKLIERLCQLLDLAQNVIRDQAELLALHEIETDDGELEKKRTELLTEIENTI